MRKKLYTPGNKKTKSSCPSCGFAVSASHSFEQVLSGGFDNPQDGSYEATRVTPVRASNIESDVLVPLLQSLVTSIAVTIPSVAVSMAMRWEWSAPIAVGAVTVAVSWFKLAFDAKSELCIQETFYYTPKEDAPGAGLTEVSSTALQLEVTDRSDRFGGSMRIVDLPQSVSQDDFVDYCRDIIGGKSMARRDWVGPGKKFSRDQYDDLVTAMDAAGLSFSVPGKGRRLTTGGKNGIRRMMAGLSS